MQLHDIHPIHKSKKKKRVGRGGKRGTYSGRGQKGQKSRAGAKFEPIIRSLIKKYPKLRGYKFKPKHKSQKRNKHVVS
jgi:large subunit ribosomal protein L15